MISNRNYQQNGANFIGGETELRETISEINQNKIYKELAAKQITLKFTPLASPWMDGAVEAIVKIIKKALKTFV